MRAQKSAERVYREWAHANEEALTKGAPGGKASPADLAQGLANRWVGEWREGLHAELTALLLANDETDIAEAWFWATSEERDQ